MSKQTTNEEIRREWEESDLAKRITSVEMFAINHHFNEWRGQTIQDWWLAKLEEQQANLKAKVMEEVDRLIAEDFYKCRSQLLSNLNDLI